jgi:excisionase family DNA binding protein
MERLMTRKQAAEYLGFAPQTLARYAWLGKGPAATKLGRSVRYKLSDLEAWIAANGRSEPSRQSSTPTALLGLRHVIDGVAYYKERDVARVLHELGPVSWWCGETADDLCEK